MNSTQTASIQQVCEAYGKDRSRLMDIVADVQRRMGCVSSEAMTLIASEVNVHRVEVESLVSFYAFLSDRPRGQVVIRLCSDVIDKMQGQKIYAHIDLRKGERSELAELASNIL